jgi:hypothetical protein
VGRAIRAESTPSRAKSAIRILNNVNSITPASRSVAVVRLLPGRADVSGSASPAAPLTGPPVSPVECVHAQPGAGSSEFCPGSPIPFGLPLAPRSISPTLAAGRWRPWFGVSVRRPGQVPIRRGAEAPGPAGPCSSQTNLAGTPVGRRGGSWSRI